MVQAPLFSGLFLVIVATTSSRQEKKAGRPRSPESMGCRGKTNPFFEIADSPGTRRYLLRRIPLKFLLRVAEGETEKKNENEKEKEKELEEKENDRGMSL